MSSNAVMYMQRTSAETVLQNSIAAVDVQPTLTISTEAFWKRTILDVSCKENVWNVRL